MGCGEGTLGIFISSPLALRQAGGILFHWWCLPGFARLEAKNSHEDTTWKLSKKGRDLHDKALLWGPWVKAL